jgi:CubicO group peptidase (beta-lactamase class C family)
MSHKLIQTCLKSSLIAIFLLFLQPAFSQSGWNDFNSELEKQQKILGNDLVALVWSGDSLVFKKEMGDFKMNTVAPIASSSKWLTAALVMMFVEEGKISLDDPVVKYIPIFEKYSKSYITIRHCLSHMTGIDDDGKLIKRLLQRKKFASLEEEVNSFAAREIRANPGTDFWYGNIGLNIAARVLEVVSKKKFDNLIKQKLFTPLGMKKTTFSTPDASALNPSGGAKSTAEDYLKFLGMLLNKGRYAGKQILTEESVDELLKQQTMPSQIKYAPKSAEGLGYALGSWVMSATKDGAANVVASPGLFGTWPMVDYCRGYTYIIFVKNLLGDERADLHMSMKKSIDKNFTYKCQ